MVEVEIAFDDGADTALGLPTYATSGAAGADLRLNLPPGSRSQGLTVLPAARVLAPTGLRIALPPGYEAQVRPRSGMALNHGMTVANAPGTIDWDYRGPLGVILVNLGSRPVHLAHGDRIAQLVVAPVEQAAFRVGALDDTERGSGGFGSTGSA